jgi:tRNA U34 5-methylaminomethyl-2-thiouridine-forming methyltransferase MnmC
VIIHFFKAKRLHATTAKPLRSVEFFTFAERDDHINLWFEEARSRIGYSVSRADLTAALEYAEKHRVSEQAGDDDDE